MLEALFIRNIVLIEELHIDFAKGLCVLTGETGAGKSILLDALGLALGAKAEPRLLRQGTEQAQVVAHFRLPPSHPVWVELDAHGLSHDQDTLLLRRLLKTDGKTQCFLNDQLISQTLLGRLGHMLVEIHGQFDRLLDPKAHLNALDSYGKVDATATQKTFQAYQETKKALSDFEASLAQSSERQAFLTLAIQELERTAPLPGEVAQLEEEKGLITHQAKLAEAMRGADLLLSPLIAPLSQVHKSLSRVQSYLPERLTSLMEASDRARIEIQEMVEEVSSLKRDLLEASHTLEKVEDRLHSLRALSRKYQTEDLVLCLMGFKQERQDLCQEEDHRQTLTQALQAKKEAYLETALALSLQRHQAARQLERALTQELAPLKLDQAHFRVHFEEMAEAGWKGSGIDRAEFYISTNPDTPEGPLGLIASGGERARFMLALKVVLLQTGTVGTLIFDEIESGTGGAVASAMGERLAHLAQRTQILAITHSPQIAALGTQHLLVLKHMVQGRTLTHLTSLDETARHEEIARMLAGHAITQEARAAAKRLMVPHEVYE